MVPVRKPGRPLTQCPHPITEPCSCGAVTAAIPRKQKCGCGISNSSDPEAKVESDASTPGSTTPSESKPTNSNFRVQKSKRGPLIRKQSIGTTELERMDPSQLNIMPAAYEGMQAGPMPMPIGYMPSMAGMHPYRILGMGTADRSYGAQPLMIPMYQQPIPSPMIHAGAPTPTPTPAPTTNGYTSLSLSSSTTPSVQPATGGCCGGRSNEGVSKTQSNPQAASPTPSSSTNGNSANATKSCCSTQNGPNLKPSPLSPLSSESHTQANGMMVPTWPTPMTMPNGMYGFFPQQTIYYPPQYGTFMQPLQPEQWKQVVATPSFGQPASPQGVGTPEYPSGTVPQSGSSNSNNTAGTSHLCTCGDDCQCVGCAAHPYNDASKNYVRSAWNSMMEDANQPQPQADQGLVNGNHDCKSSAGHIPNETTAAPTQSDTSTGVHTPNTPGSLTEEQTLSPNDFFFVTYPFGDSCDGETASCPCGDDCQCIGCVIHNNPGPA